MLAKKTKLVLLLSTLASLLFSMTARATILPVTGHTGWSQAVDYSVQISGPDFTFSMFTCDAPELQIWTGPFTSTTQSGGCVQSGSASYKQNTWTRDFGAGDRIDALITEAPVAGACGPVVINPKASYLWSVTCAALLSGSFYADTFPGYSPALSGTLKGTGSVTFDGTVPTGGLFLNVDSYSTTFTARPNITASAPEPGSLPLLLTGTAVLLALRLRRSLAS
jgi:hypothetical protein